MHISNSLNNFLNDSQSLSHSIILLADRNNFIFVSPSNPLYFNTFMNHSISKELKHLFKQFKQEKREILYSNSSNSTIKLIYHDSIAYQSQIILPINKNFIEGLLIFFSTDREYLPSNLRFAKTTKYLIEKLMKSS